MGLFRDDAGKTERATPTRLTEIRDKGQTPVSRELTMAGSLLIAVLAIEYLGPWLMGNFQLLLQRGLSVDLREHGIDGDMPDLLREVYGVVLTIAPPLVVLLVIFVAGTALFGYGQIGFRISKKVLGFKIEKLNPVANIGKLMSFGSVMKAILAAGKLALLGSVLWAVLQSRWGDIADMHSNENFALSVGLITELAFKVFFWIAIVVLILSIADISWQRHDFQERNKMTKQEVEDERKRSEGDPLVKSRMRTARNELMRQRMMEAVPKADVVITNPTHFSVALAYDRRKNAAPSVVAKGANEVALRIRELARENDVPLMEDPPLARALFRAVKVGQEIPEKFYQAVATVLGHVFRMKGRVA